MISHIITLERQLKASKQKLADVEKLYADLKKEKAKENSPRYIALDKRRSEIEIEINAIQEKITAVQGLAQVA